MRDGERLTGTDEVAALAESEIVEHSVSVLLVHTSVNVEAGVTQLCYLFSQQLHS